MKHIKTISALIFLVILFSGCAQQQAEPPVPGTYEMEQSQEPVPPYVTLQQDGTFQFTYAVLSSNMPVGTYQVVEDRLLLQTADKQQSYMFQIDGTALRFQKEQSSPLQIGGKDMIPDGALFRLKQENGGR